MASGSGQGGYQANDRVGQLRGQVSSDTLCMRVGSHTRAHTDNVT